jgi:lysozyme
LKVGHYSSGSPFRLALKLIAPLIIGLLLIFFYSRSWHPSLADFPSQGVDISHHQGEIDWSAAHAAGVDFAYIKASEGADMRDPMFADNWKGARDAGVRRGAYHFFTLCRLARDQATNFIATVPREADALPPVLDLEFGGNCASRPTRAVVLAEIATYVQMVEAHTEKPVMLYMTQEFEEEYQVSAAIKRPLWLRQLYFQPTYGSHPWVMWQASNLRHVSGISGAVDWNVVRP